MKTRKMALVAALIAILAAPVLADDVALTVYNQNLALVHETRTLDFSKGLNEMRLTDVAASIDPTSVHFKMVSPGNVQLLEQNYQYDLVSPDKILRKYLGKSVDVVMKNGDLFSGELLSAAGGYLTLRMPDGSLRLVNSAEQMSVSTPSLPEGLILVPTLEWKLQSDVEGKKDAEISYLTDNIGWHAEYIAALSHDEKSLQLSGWVSLDNRSGKTYKDAKLKLVAGDIQRVQQPRPTEKGMMRMEASAAPGFQEKAFFEYHLYTLGRRTTIADNETKQVSLFDPATTPIEKIYRYQAAEGNTDVGVVVKFKNSETNNLGMPLPAGKIRVTKADSDGSEEFLGEDSIDHTPRNEDVEIKVGNAFDIVGETATMSTNRISDRVRENTMQVKLRNRKTEPVTVVVQYNIYGDWQITQSSHEYTKKNARLIEFPIPVAADTEEVLTFTVRIR